MKKNAAQKKEETSHGSTESRPTYLTERAVVMPGGAIGVIRRVRYSDIERDPNQPRKIFAEGALKDLAESIASVGLRQPPLVVENPPKFKVREPDLMHEDYAVVEIATGEIPVDVSFPIFNLFLDPQAEAQKVCEQMNGLPYRIVAGERRWRAVGLLGWEEMDVQVVQMTPAEIASYQLVENIQREALDALEEAEGFQRIVDEQVAVGKSSKEAVEFLCAQVGKSRSAIYQRLALLKLSDVAKEAYLAGKVEVSIAELVSKIPDQKLQKKALEEILKGGAWVHELEKGSEEAGVSVRECMSFRQARQHVMSKYMLSLKYAPFNQHSKDLLMEAGSCVACPHRTGNARDLFPHIKAKDICTLPSCYEKKVSLGRAAVLAHAAAEGKTVVEGAFLDWGQLAYGYVQAKETCDADKRARSYEELMKKGKAKVEPVYGLNRQMELVPVYHRDQVEGTLIQLGLMKDERATAEETEAANKELELAHRVSREVFRKMLVNAPAELDFLRFTLKNLLELAVENYYSTEFFQWILVDVAGVKEAEEWRKDSLEEWHAEIMGRAKTWDYKKLYGAILCALVGELWYRPQSGEWSAASLEAAKICGVDPEKVMAEMRNPGKSKAKGKAKDSKRPEKTKGKKRK